MNLIRITKQASRNYSCLDLTSKNCFCQKMEYLTGLLMKSVLNNALPTGITVRSVEQMPDTFHPRVGVKEKVYYYHFFTEQPIPFVSRYGLFVPKLADNLEAFKEALQK